MRKLRNRGRAVKTIDIRWPAMRTGCVNSFDPDPGPDQHVMVDPFSGWDAEARRRRDAWNHDGISNSRCRVAAKLNELFYLT